MDELRPQFVRTPGQNSRLEPVRFCRAWRPLLAAVMIGMMLASTWFLALPARAEDGPDDASAALIVTADFNHDGLPDFAKVAAPEKDHPGHAHLVILLGQADGPPVEVASLVAPGPAPTSIAAGDFNKDGHPDILLGDSTGALMLFQGDGTGRMAPAGTVAHFDSVVSIAVADFNHDGIPDIAVSDWRASRATVLLGDGKGGFGPTWSFPLRMRGKAPHLAAADFNGDGIPDLAVVYDDDDGDTYDVMLNNGNGTFSAAPDLGFVKDPNAHCVT